MSKGQKFLKVTSILMIIGGALAGVTCLLGIAGVAVLASLADGHAAALMLYLALALALAAAVAACACTETVTVEGWECTNKSYPRFGEDFNALKREETP